MNAFKQRLLAGSGALRESRANQIVAAVDSKVQAIKLDIANRRQALTAEKDVLLDLGPDESTSLRVASHDFSPTQLVLKLQGINEQLHQLDIEEGIVNMTIADLNTPVAAPEPGVVGALTGIE